MQTGLHAVEGRRCVSQALRAGAPVTGPVWVAAIGKAALAMASGAHEALGPRVERTLVITRDALPAGCPAPPGPAEVLYGAHPLPDERSLEAGARLLAWVDELPPAVQPLFLISGGASSLVEVLAGGATLAQLQDLNRAALAQGLAIGEFNARRIRISRIKGGQLAQRLDGREGRALFISDVPGDDVAVIGSGIMGPPPAGPDHIQRRVVASVDAAVAAVAARGRELGLAVHAPLRRFDDNAARLAARFAHELSLTAAQLCVWGGESTLALPARPGRGGRNQHLALAAARLIAGHPDLMLLAIGSDGSDGVTDDAGALVDAESCSRLTLAHLDADVCLRNADSAAALAASGDLVHTGPTGTNVGDLVIGLKLSAAGARSLPQPRGGERMRVL
jgi:glycerate 2-kinase